MRLKSFKIPLTWNDGKTKVCSLGINADRYKKNPVVLLNHNGYQLPIGKCASLEIKKNKINGAVELIQSVQGKKHLKNWGIGFISKKSHVEGNIIVHDEIELLEISVMEKGE